MFRHDPTKQESSLYFGSLPHFLVWPCCDGSISVYDFPSCKEQQPGKESGQQKGITHPASFTQLLSQLISSSPYLTSGCVLGGAGDCCCLCSGSAVLGPALSDLWLVRSMLNGSLAGCNDTSVLWCVHRLGGIMEAVATCTGKKQSQKSST